MFESLKQDFQRAKDQTSYKGNLRKTLHVITSPGFQAILNYRFNRWLLQRRIPVIGLIGQRLTEVWTGISIPPEAKIGPGLLILHFGGIVINSQAVLGANVTLHHQVTVGNRVSGGASPKIGDEVEIGAGAKVLGDIKIGKSAKIGANAVVLTDVPDGGVAVGIPAKIVKQK